MPYFSLKMVLLFRIKIVSNKITNIFRTLRNSDALKAEFKRTRFWYNQMARTLLQLRSKIEQ